MVHFTPPPSRLTFNERPYLKKLEIIVRTAERELKESFSATDSRKTWPFGPKN